MKIELKEKKDESAVFGISGIPVAYLNALRRTLIARIKVFAIDEVTFFENNSPYWDEYIAHRIGQVPLRMRLDYSKEEYYFMLEEEGPKEVMSNALKPESEEVKVAIENIPLFTLREGERVKLEGKAILGVGRKHAKFQAGLASYEYDEKGNAIFYVESYGNLPIKEYIEYAFDTLLLELNMLKKEIEEKVEE